MRILLDVLGTNEIMILFLLLGLFIIPTIFFLITQQNTLKAIQVQNRTMSPGEVWLQLIPLFNLVWQFIVVNKISESIRRELASEKDFSFETASESNYEYYHGKMPTREIGIAYCVLALCSLIPVIGSFAGLAALICWIIYWVKLSQYKTKIEVKRNSEISSEVS
jgi:hypothetical protein